MLADDDTRSDGTACPPSLSLIAVNEPNRGLIDIRSSAFQVVTWLDGPNAESNDPAKTVVLGRTVNRKPTMSQKAAPEDYVKSLAGTL